ncbi:MAG: kelch repeat-containing protein [Candidatus Lutacidiplasmatales archaeon]
MATARAVSGDSLLLEAQSSLTPGSIASHVASPTWLNLTPGQATSPPGMWEGSMAYDPLDGYMVLFGGANLSWGAHQGVFNQTWTFSKGQWAQIHPSPSPSVREGAAIAYDPNAGGILLFGGTITQASGDRDTWLFAHGSWTNLTGTLARSPPGRYWAGMTYDAKDGYTVLFGGAKNYYNGYRNLSDTWRFAHGQWQNISSVSTKNPGARFFPAMAYDVSDRYVVLFGGVTHSWNVLSDTWKFTGGRWTQLPVAAPPAVLAAGMTYDAAYGYLILYGGQTTTGSWSSETWRFHAGSWVQLASAGPPGRVQLTMAYDDAMGYTILFGGLCPSGGGACNDTWEFKSGGAAWTNMSGATRPSARVFSSMAYDGHLGKVVLFGGWMISGYRQVDLNDTWLFSSGSWSLLATKSAPPGRAGAAFTFDAGDGVDLLFGGANITSGALNDTWTFNGTDWTRMSPAVSPASRSFASLTFDSAVNASILFGGDNYYVGIYAETWEYSAGTWVNVTTRVGTAPPSRFGAAMTYDSADGSLLMFGGDGHGLLHDTWVFNGTAWQNHTGSRYPSSRLWSALIFDPLNGGVFLFGGDTGTAFLHDTWVFHSGAWHSLSPASSPSNRLGTGYAYDQSAGYGLVFGGEGAGFLSDTWALDR